MSESKRKSAKEIAESILDWSQENHGMSPYLRQSLKLGIIEAIQAERRAIVFPEKFFKPMHFDNLPKSRDGRATKASMCAQIANTMIQNRINAIEDNSND